VWCCCASLRRSDPARAASLFFAGWGSAWGTAVAENVLERIDGERAVP